MSVRRMFVTRWYCIEITQISHHAYTINAKWWTKEFSFLMAKVMWVPYTSQVKKFTIFDQYLRKHTR